MIKYTKLINDKRIVEPKENIIIYKEGKQIINPSIEMILDDGWVEYNKEIEIQERLISLDAVKWEMFEKINSYDKSENVEIFFIGDTKLWLNREERNSLQRRFELELKNNIEYTTLWKNNIRFNINVADAIVMLDMLELYAIKTYDITQQHIANVNNMTNVDDVLNYDYTIGYPNKLVFEISQ